MLHRLQTELLPRLDDVRREWEFNYDSKEAPEEHMQQLVDSFETLKKYFGDDERAVRIIDREIQYANEWIVENTPEEPKRSPRKLGNVGAPEKPPGTRSIFDDIDG